MSRMSLSSANASSQIQILLRCSSKIFIEMMETTKKVFDGKGGEIQPFQHEMQNKYGSNWA